MSGYSHYRTRGETICFRMNLEERRELEARIAVSGMPKGEYFRESLLHQQITVSGGQYQSDRLSIEFKRLCEALELVQTTEEVKPLLEDCKSLVEQMLDIKEAAWQT